MGFGPSRPVARGIIITFDALGTLYRFRQPVAQQYLAVAEKCGLKAQIPIEELDSSFQAAFKLVNADHPNYGKDTLSSPEEWWNEVVERAFGNVVEGEKLPPDLGASLYSHFSSGAAYELYADVRPFLRRIHEIRRDLDKGLENDSSILLGVITNSDPRVKQVLQSMSLKVGIDKDPITSNRSALALGLEHGRSGGGKLNTPFKQTWSRSHDFDFLSTSYDAGYQKPHYKIFRHAANLAMYNIMGRVERSIDDEGTSIMNRIRAARAITSHIRDISSMEWIHIGDEYSKDYVGAEEHDLDAFHLVRQGEGTQAVEGARTISNLVELLPVINVMAEENL